VSGSGLRRLTSDGADVFHSPTWAPNGDSIAFKSGGLFDETGQPSEQGERSETRFAIVEPDGSGIHLVGPSSKDCSLGSWKNECRLVGPAWQPR
jgi:Tol biopolymer transport system component